MKELMINLISREGYKIGYDTGADYTPLDYMLNRNPKTTLCPKGFRKLIIETCPKAIKSWQEGNKVCGWLMRDIIEQDFNRNDTRW